jgi:hypothetical protein
MNHTSWRRGGSLLLIALLGFACKQPVDVTAPTLELLDTSPVLSNAAICGQPSERVFSLVGGDTLFLDMILRDDVGLSQYKIEIHHNFDCHGHAGKVADWNYLEVVDVSGTEARITRSIPVPEAVSAGAYMYHYQAVDLAGNSNSYAEYYDLLVTNLADEIPPVLTLTEPGGDLEQARGSLLKLRGTVTDNLPLSEGGKGQLLLTYGAEAGGNRFEAGRWEIPSGTGEQYPFELTFELPQTLVPGPYLFSLNAFDGVNNAANPQRFVVQVTR